MIKVLMVCHGNICRSPMAEFIMKDVVKSRGLEDDFYIESAATSREEIGNDVYPYAKDKMIEKGVNFSKRSARQITKGDYDKFDYIIGMDENNRKNIYKIMGGDPDNKIYLLLDFTSNPHPISDPWYSGDFETTYNEITEGVESLLKKIF